MICLGTLNSAQITACTAGPSGSEMSAKTTGKIRILSQDDHSAFHQQPSYAHSSNSTCSLTILPSTTTSAGPNTTAPPKNLFPACIKNKLNEKLSDFTRETDNLLKEAKENHTHCYVAKVKYAT